MGIDFLVVLVENVESVFRFSLSSVDFAVGGFPVVPQIVNRGGDFLFSVDVVVFVDQVAGSENGSEGK